MARRPASVCMRAAGLLAALLAANEPRIAAARPLFAAGYEAYQSHGGCPSVAAGDLDHDGLPDVAAANPDSQTVSVWLGLGEGSLGTRVDLPIGGSPRSVTLADLDGDTHLDLVVADAGAPRLLILRGLGNGAFTPPAEVIVGAVPLTAVVGDLNGDGLPDLVTGAWAALGNGDGTFQPSYATGGPDGIPTLATLDGGATLDLAVTRGGDGISVSLGNGDGTFQTRVDYAGNSNGITAGDLDGDGALELVTTSPASFLDVATSVRVFSNQGNGAFGASTTYWSAAAPDRVELADVNGDGTLDALAGAGSGLFGAAGGVTFLYGMGDGTLASGIVRQVGPCPAGLAVADFDQDGVLDAVTGSTCGNLYVTLGNGNGSFGRAPESVTSGITHAFPVPSDVELGDLDHDGPLDAVVTNENAATLMAMIPDGVASLGDTAETGTADRPVAVALGDLDGDGWLDAAVAGGLSRRVTVLRGQPGGSFGDRTDVLTNSSGLPGDVTAAHLDADGDLDLAVANGAPNAVTVLFGDGDAGFAAPADVPIGSTAVAVVRGAVVSASDLVVAHAGGVSVVTPNGDRTFQPPIVLAATSPACVTLGDFDGDSQTDIASAGGSPGSVDLRLRHPNGTFAPRTTFPAGVTPTSIAAGDLNADGFLDLAIAGDAAGMVAVHLGHGDGTFEPWRGFGGVGRTPDVAVGDVSGDGLPELVVTNSNRGSVSVLLNQRDAPAPVSVPAVVPQVMRIASLAPNPARAGVVLALELVRAAPLRVDVFDARGRRVRTLAEVSRAEAGMRRIAWDGKDARGAAAAPGVYWVVARSDDNRVARRIVVLK